MTHKVSTTGCLFSITNLLEQEGNISLSNLWDVVDMVNWLDGGGFKAFLRKDEYGAYH